MTLGRRNHLCKAVLKKQHERVVVEIHIPLLQPEVFQIFSSSLEASPQDAQAVATEQLGRAEKILASWSADDRYLFLAKLNGVSARVIQQTLERPPFNCFAAVTTVDSRFHRLRQRLIEDIREP